ncbi:MAG TPA: NAD(P)H-dependent oxidoreductase [Pseudonocardiaceae bacterium]|nr:NAD(P)H-dependent oxidoreductase [Pseudonocardiaceae bacterium]
MSQLLHIDASMRTSGSVSRELSAAFAQRWRAAHPEGTYVYRDLAATPVPHLDHATYTAAALPDEEHTAEQRVAWAISSELIDELTAADTVVLGLPMYNFSVPSTVKAWLDRIITPRTAVDKETGVGSLVGKRFVVTASRGGAYGPGMPREDFEFQERYLRAALSSVGLDADLTFVNAELTLAGVVPAMAQFKDLAAESLENAHRTARELAASR